MNEAGHVSGPIASVTCWDGPIYMSKAMSVFRKGNKINIVF
jgi:hypothetical protein